MADQTLPLFPVDRLERIQLHMTRTQVAYLAGLLDGEGTFGLYQTPVGMLARNPEYRYYRTFIKLTLSDRWFLDSVWGLVGWETPRVVNCKNTLRGRERPSYQIHWTGVRAECLCRALLPYLRLKKRHAEILIRLGDARTAARVHFPRVNRGERRFPPYIWEMYETAWKELRALNIRGQDNS